MANTKNYSLREKIIDTYLRRGWYTRQQIEDACNKALMAHGENPITSRQTLMNDFLAISQKYRITIEKKKDGRNILYRYKDRNFSIFKSELSDLDLSRLKEALNVLSHFRGMPQFDWVDELRLRFKMGLHDPKNPRPFVSFEDSAYNTGVEFFTPIYTAIDEKTTISIDYKSFKRSSSKEFVLSPYFLKEYNNRWFVLGKSPGYERVSIYPLDRILSMKNAGVPYEETDIDFESYFDNVIGVTLSDQEPEIIEIWVSNQQLGYVETKPLHRSQSIISTDETGGVVQIEIIPNYELEDKILGMGEHAKVLAPESLKAKIKARIAENLKNYK